MFILTETSNSLRAISSSLVVNVKGKKVLLLAQGKSIAVYLFKGKALELVTTWSVEHKILSWAKFSHKSFVYVILLDSAYKVKLLDLSQFNPHGNDINAPIRTAVKLSTQGQRESPNLDAPIIIPLKEIDPEYIIFHIFYSNIQVFSVKELLLNFNKAVTPTTYSTGQIDIKQMVHLPRTVYDKSTREGTKRTLDIWSLAVLYKDITSSYYVRYLDFCSNTSSLVVARQLDSFAEEPSLILPCVQNPGGLIVLTGSSMFYFPPEQYRHISIERQMKNVLISTKTDDVHLIMTLNKPGRGKHKTIYKCFELIDSQRTLLTTAEGKCFMLFIDLSVSTSSSLIVNQINFLDLDYITTPIFNGLHHVDGNQFFQASKTSKSVLFEILPTRPNINILNSIEGNPPVIDLKETCNSSELFACQGGWDGSQLRRYTLPSCKYQVMGISRVSESPLKFIGESEDRYIFGTSTGESTNINGRVLRKDFTAVTSVDHLDEDVLSLLETETTNIALTRSKLLANGNVIIERSIKLGTISPNEGIVSMATTDNHLHVYYFLRSPNGFRFCYICDMFFGNDDEISSMDVCNDKGTYWILCSFFSGKYKIWRSNGERPKLVFEGSSEQAVFSSCIYTERSFNQEEAISVYIFFSFINGFVNQVQLRMSNETLIPTKSTCEKLSNIPYLWRRSRSNILGFNSEGLVIPKKVHALDQFGYTKIERPHVVDVRFDSYREDDSSSGREKRCFGNVIVALDNGEVEKWAIEFGELARLQEFSSLYSEKLFIKCLPLGTTNYAIVVAYDTTSSPNEIKTELLLVDSINLEICDVFKFHDDTEIVDLCELTEHQLKSIKLDTFTGFICLSSSSDKSPVAIFKVLNSQIKLIERIHISGMKSASDLKFTSIASSQGSPLANYVVTGSLNFLCNLCYLKGFQLAAIPHAFMPASSLGVASTIGEHTVIIADAIAGINSYGSDSFELRDSGLLNSAGKYLTTISQKAPPSRKNLRVAGYTSGDICIFDGSASKFDPLMVKFSIEGDQINSIIGSEWEIKEVARLARIGTLSGGIYTLNIILDTAWEEILQNCEQELTTYARKNNLSTISVKELDHDNFGLSRAASVIDGRTLPSFFGDSKAAIDDKFQSLNANRSKLQEIYSQCCL
ncbi:hypothetical protein CANMA_004069 [Candida margitis]|uniref:uncharacterized protein n=1 Tax=Candida margitis TaxID=1775924 RepID=UPI002225FA78|nr:uncharacterized protein CANMA_004069 [Candida margitis]KAI5959969.1 hypothetical protein CANMA_004069 [Candida margitis]